MNKLHNDCKVYIVRSFEEAQKIIIENSKLHAVDFIKKLFIDMWVLYANTLLRILRFLLFKKYDLSQNKIKKIVAYTHGIVGDNVVMLPSLAAIKKRFPDSKITIIADLGPYPKAPSEIILGAGFIDDLVVLNQQPLLRKGLKLIVDPKIRGISCDLFVDLAPYGNRGWLKAVLREMLFAWKIHAKYAIGFYVSTKMSRGILNNVQHYFIKNEPRRSAAVLRELGLSPVINMDLLPKDDRAKEEVLKKIQNKVNDHKSIFILNPGGNLDVKRWPYQKYTELAKFISQKYDSNIIITGISSESDIAAKIIEGSQGYAINMVGETSIQELIELLRISKACVTNDTGTMHIAAMIGLPTIAIFGTRLHPSWWFPKGKNFIALFCLLECSYCFKDYCETKNCLNKIEVSHVMRALEELLEGDREIEGKEI
jgi:ADP-heptose:LPS heptosyltransferase